MVVFGRANRPVAIYPRDEFGVEYTLIFGI